MQIEPAGNRILIKRDDVEAHDPVFASARGAGIAIPQTEEQMRRQAGMDRGKVLKLGVAAFKDPFYMGINWCNEGDFIIFPKYSGKPVTNLDTGEEFLIINDSEVVAVLKDYNG